MRKTKFSCRRSVGFAGVPPVRAEGLPVERRYPELVRLTPSSGDFNEANGERMIIVPVGAPRMAQYARSGRSRLMLSNCALCAESILYVSGFAQRLQCLLRTMAPPMPVDEDQRLRTVLAIVGSVRGVEFFHPCE